MYTNALSLLALFAGASIASPCSTTPTASSYSVSATTSETSSAATSSETAFPADAKFGLMALRSATPVHFAQFSAALSSIFLNLPAQNASCDSSSDNYATFYLKDGGLYLYSDSATPQQLYVDRSGMGQGKLGYTTGAQSAPANGERSTFSLTEYNDLLFNDVGFLACPNSIDGSWSVWVDAGVEEPAGNSGCLELEVRAIQTTQPDSCVYTE